MVEHLTRNEDVCGSIPHGGSIKKPFPKGIGFGYHQRKFDFLGRKCGWMNFGTIFYAIVVRINTSSVSTIFHFVSTGLTFPMI
jgi:hypothetical protein